MSILIVILGIAGLTRMPVRELPNVDTAEVTVSVTYTGASPEVVDNEVTTVMESAIASVPGIERISSEAELSGSRTVVTLRPGRDIDDGAADIRAAVQAAAAEAAGHEGKYLINLLNTTRQPILASLENRDLRRRVWEASATRGAAENGPLIQRIVALRAQKAELLGYPSWAHYVLEEQMAKILRRKMAVMRDGFIFIPNHYEAQHTARSDKARQRELREKRRALAAASELQVRSAMSSADSGLEVPVRSSSEPRAPVGGGSGPRVPADDCDGAVHTIADVAKAQRGDMREKPPPVSRGVTPGHGESPYATLDLRNAEQGNAEQGNAVCRAQVRAHDGDRGESWRLAELQVELRDAVIDELGLKAKRFECVQPGHREPIAAALVAEGFTPQQLEDALRARAGEARGLGTVKYLDGVRNWKPEQIRRAMVMTPEEAEQDARERTERKSGKRGATRKGIRDRIEKAKARERNAS